jgi:copper(I)-binding protein
MTHAPCPYRPRTAKHASASGHSRFYLFLLLCAGISLSIPAAWAQTSADLGLVISKPWMRFIIPGRPAAGYFVLSNETDRERTLTGASSPACKSIMLHRSLHEDGMERMVMVDSVPIPAHGGAAFSPGGYHLMCMMPTDAVRNAADAGASVPVTLVFADGAHLRVDFVVKGISGAGE